MLPRRPTPIIIAATCGLLMALVCALLAGLVLDPMVADYDTPPVTLVIANAAVWSASLILVVGAILLLRRGGRLLLAAGSVVSLAAVWLILILAVSRFGGYALTFASGVAFVSLLPIAAIYLPGRPEARNWCAAVQRRIGR